MDYFSSISVELQTQINWLPNKILSEVCSSVPEVICPEEFTVDKRILAGTLSSHRLDPITWSTGTTLYMKFGEKVGSTIYGFIFDLNQVSYTSRLSTGEIYKHNYDWRLTENPDSLAQLIEYVTDQADDSRAILDFWGLAILDSDNLPILDSF
jgi:hypothetical protein